MADSTGKAKKKRGIVRGRTTRIFKKVEIELQKDAPNLDHLEELFAQLRAMEDLLEDLDRVIEDGIQNLEELDTEVTASLEYREKIISWKTRISRSLRRNKRSESEISSSGRSSSPQAAPLENTEPMELGKDFWRQFTDDVVCDRKWYLSELPNELLKTNISNVVSNSLKLKLQHRRSRALELRKDPIWSHLICQAMLQLSLGQTEGGALKIVSSSHFLNPLEDYFKHLQYFALVAGDMAVKDVPVVPLGSNCSRIHDLDKLDPIMLVAYAERFEDGLETELWNTCVRNHVTSNPHHPEHPIWQLDNTCNKFSLRSEECHHCDDLRFRAVREMVADRVSRRVQKELGGILGPAAWDISPTWFSDLPAQWFGEALSIISTMKRGWE